MLTVLSVVLGVLAGLHRGVPLDHLDLHDGGVWVTNKAMNMVAHLNYPSRTLDGGLLSASSTFDVFQHGTDVGLVNPQESTAAAIDVAGMTLGSAGSLPATADVTFGGGVAAVVDKKSGKAWAMASSDIGSFSTTSVPLGSGLSAPRGIVDVDGDLLVVTGDGTAITWHRDGKNWTRQDAGRLNGYDPRHNNALTAVGDTLVVLDRDAHVLRTPSGTSPMPTGDLQLQQVGPASDSVLASSASALLTVPIAGGQPASRPVAAGTAVAPVYFNGCAYAAWTGSGAYLRDCPSSADDIAKRVDKIAQSKNMAFRTNRDVIVLNDVDNGLVLLVDQNMRVVNNWQQTKADLEEQKKTSDRTSQNVSQTTTIRQSKVNHPPVAKPDDFGVRAGQANWLPVLANDEDPDGDILTAQVDRQPAAGRVQPVSKGESLQIVMPETAKGNESFNYSAHDGRGGSAAAAVRVSVHPWSQNSGPQQLREAKLTISQGGSISYNVTPDWYDPDGDQIYLASTGAVNGMTVDSRPDGSLMIKDLGTEDPGTRKIQVTMTDGRASTTGYIRVEVKAGRKNVPPVANNDHVEVPLGQSIIASPIANDTDANGDKLTLTTVGRKPGLTVSPDYSAGTVAISGTKTGSFYLTYGVSDSKAQSQGLIRVDVTDPGSKGEPPVAVADLAVVQGTSSTLVDLTANDSDPMGGVLVVQGLKVGSGLSVQLLDHHIARIAAAGRTEGTSSFSYTVSNGYGSATGRVAVVHLPSATSGVPPKAENDSATVRSGDVATVDVLANDSSPSHLTLSLDPRVDVTGDVAGGVAFVSNNKLTFRAGTRAGSVRVAYTVRDSQGSFASAFASFTVTALNAPNDPPRPTPINARTVAGQTVRIPIATSGSDPDGDSVVVTGLGLPAARLGAVTVADGYLEYTPSDGASGTDTFGYTVADQFGASGTGIVRVGIAPASGINQAPYAVADSVAARPGRALSIPVLRNDSDPDGDEIHLVSGGVKPVDSATTTAVTVRNDRVELTTPTAPGTLRYYYAITDGRGGRAEGVLTITVSQTAPLQYPVAGDDVVTSAQVAGKQSVTVDVLANDEDPDGATSALVLKSGDPGVTVAPSRRLVIAVKPKRQMVVYSITDPDHQTAYGVVTVPGSNDQRPTIDTTRVPVKVVAGQQAVIKLSDYVRVRSGHSPRITYAAAVRAAAGANGGSLVKNATTLQFTSTNTFAGMTSLTFEVTDGSSPTDAKGLKAVLALPIEVKANPTLNNRPPVWHVSQISVAAGEPARTVDLTEMVTDPNQGQQGRLRFTLASTSQPFKASLSGSQLRVSAPDDARSGTPGTIQATVATEKGRPVTAAIPITVVSSTKPLLSLAPISVNNASAGKPSVVNLSSYITNPFASVGKPAHLVGRPALASGQGSVSSSGLNVTITPGAAFHGQLTVSYRVGDATNDPAREVTGQIAVTVRDRPGAPSAVVAVSNASRSADISWQAGPDNGAPISGFEVAWHGDNGSSGSQSVGQVTTLSLSNLTNNVWYTFTVVATNEVGRSAASASSNRVRPDTRPDQVGAPTGTFGDRQATVSWPAGSTQGAPIASYTVRISPAAGGVSVREGVHGTQCVWSGLSNGTSYTFTVVAVSANDLESEPSASSAGVVPAGAPFAPAGPRVGKDPAGPTEPSATVSWSAPNGNGDDAMTYEVRQSGGGTVYSGTGLTTHATLPVSTSDQTFQVRATNKSRRWSEWSSASNAIRPFRPANPVSGLSVRPTGANNTVTFSFSPGALNGARSDEVRYEWSSNGVTGTVSPGQTQSNGQAFPNGQAVNVQVWPVSTVNGETSQGNRASASVNAYGPPRAPQVSARGNVNDVTLSWDAAGSGNGRDIAGVEIEGVGAAGASGSRNQGDGRNQHQCITVRARDSEGHLSDPAQACGDTWGSPNAAFSDSGLLVRNLVAGTGRDNWHVANITLRSFNPNSRVYCYVGGRGAPDYSITITVDQNGNWGPDHPRGDQRGWATSAGHIDSNLGTCEQR